MAIKDYINRTIDLSAFKGQALHGEKLLRMALAEKNNSGEILTGINKLAQRFLLELLTESGSMPYLPNRGCSFMQQARLGQWRTMFDIMAGFSASLLDIKENLVAEESSSDPDDERFADAELMSVALTGTNASISIKVTSLAGTSRTFISPLQITL